MRRLHFIVNPAAGRGKALEVWSIISDSLSARADAQGVLVEITKTYVNEPLPSLPPEVILVSVGGDGSAHYAAREALRLDCGLAIIAGGTGNDMVRNLGLPTDLDGMMDMLLTGTLHTIDVIRINADSAFNLAGYGIDAEVVHWIERHAWLKKVGRLGYGVVVPLVLWKHRRFDVTVRTENNVMKNFTNVSIFAIANAPLFGGGMRIAPMACPSDGELDLVIATGLSKLGMLRLFPQIYRGTHVSHPAVTCLRSRRFTIEFSHPLTAAEYDGERYQTPSYAEVEVVPELKVLLPLPASN